MQSELERDLAFQRVLAASGQPLSQDQIKQIRIWGQIAFPHLTPNQWQAEADMDRSVLTYRLKTPRLLQRPDNFAKLLASLVMSVTWLLGLTWTMRVVENGKTLYQSEALTENERKQRNTRKRARKNRKKPKR